MFLKLLGYQTSSLLASQLLLLISWADTIEMSISISTLSFQAEFRFCWWRGGTTDPVISRVRAAHRTHVASSFAALLCPENRGGMGRKIKHLPVTSLSLWTWHSNIASHPGQWVEANASGGM